MNTPDDLRDWSDMRLFLAVVDHGTLVAAAEHLGVSQPTMGRRLSAFQRRVGATLFAREGRRLMLTDAGRSIVEHARRMQTEMLAIDRTLDVQTSGLTGLVTISATEGTGTEWLAPELHAFHEQYPDIMINLLIEARAVDLVQREADIALRIGEPSQPDLIAKRLVDIGFGFYANREYVARQKPITEEADIESLDLIGFQNRGEPPRMVPIQSHPWDETARFVFTANSLAAQVSAMRSGYGIGVASHRWAAMYPELVNVLPGYTVGTVPLWIVTHEELRYSARIRAVFDFLTERVRAAASIFETGQDEPRTAA